MIQVRSTPNYAGASITGSDRDVEQLSRMLETLAGDEGEHPGYESARVRVMGFCAELRRALATGEQESATAGAKILWPELIFVSIALNGFIKLFYRKKTDPDWDRTLAGVRKFQESVAACLRQTLKEPAFRPVAGALGSQVFLEENYVTQYLDELNAQFLELDPQRRLASIAEFAKRIVQQGEDYRKCKSSVLEAARLYQCPVDEIRLRERYKAASEIVW
jgi:hypothetical protein